MNEASQNSLRWAASFLAMTFLGIILFTTRYVLIIIFIAMLWTLLLIILQDKVFKNWKYSKKHPKIWVFGTLLALIAFAFIYLGNQITSDIQTLIQRWPEYQQQIQQYLSETEWIQQISQKISWQDIWEQQSQILARASSWGSALFNAIAYTVLVFAIGFYLFVSPQHYSKGVMLLVPPKKREDAEDIWDRCRNILEYWLLGKTFTMALIGVSSMILLLFLEVPYAISIGIMTGLLTFIPNFGPISSALIAALAGATQGWTTVIIILSGYAFLQFIESYFITPMIEKRMTTISPAVVLMTQIVMGFLFGFPGLIIATPLTLVVKILIEEIYLKRTLGEKI